MDVHIPRAITLGLRMRSIDVLTAQEDGTATLSDPELLDKATELNRIIFTFDDDLIIDAVRRQKSGQFFSGVIFAHPLHISIGQCVREIEIIGKVGEPEDLQSRIEFLPL